MATFTFNLPNAAAGSAKTFDVKGPVGMTLEQARAIFDQQANTGSLVGFKSGDALSALTQAAAGLQGALAQSTQAVSGIIGALGARIPGAAGVIGAISAPSSSLGSAVKNAIGSVSKVLATTAITSPIDIADFAKQAAALAPIAGISLPQVTGILAQAKSLVAQGSAVLTNAKGLGAYGFDVSQLEIAGYVKPGIAAAFGTKNSADVLKSPAVWTGKDGITAVGGLLSNPLTQDKIQQNLMGSGLNSLSQIGIPVTGLSADLLSGLALNSAKSVTDTVAFVKGLPLSADVQSKLNITTASAAFAVNLTNLKIPLPFKDATMPLPAIDTVNRATIDAAMIRITGNNKIPKINFGAVGNLGTLLT